MTHDEIIARHITKRGALVKDCRALGYGAPIWVTWTGGNGPHRYVLTWPWVRESVESEYIVGHVDNAAAISAA